MSKKRETKAGTEEGTLRVEGSAPIARLQELLGTEAELKLEIVAPRGSSPLPGATKVR